MADVTLVQGNTAPAITGQILKNDGTARDLSDVSEVRFQMRRPDDKKFTVDAVAEITNASEGMVLYEWAANDLSAADDFQCQWKLTFASGKVQTTDPPNTITVRRQ